MANEILQTLLRLNLAAAAAILVVMFLRRGVRRVVGARAAYALWLAVPAAVIAGLVPARILTIPLPGVSQLSPAGDTLAPLAPAQPPALPFDWAALTFGLWITGALLGLSWLVWRHCRFMATVSRWDAKDRVRSLADGVGPAVVGVVAPKILLPQDFDRRFSVRERDVVLAHEQFHLRQGHAQTNAAVMLAQCLNWFNPALHIAARALRLDQELACDEAVIERFPKARRSYAEAMLKTQLAPAPLPLGCYWPARGSALRQRLALLHAPSPTPLRMGMGAGLAAFLAVVAGVGAWAAQPARLVYTAIPEGGRLTAQAPQPATDPAQVAAVPRVEPAPAPAQPLTPLADSLQGSRDSIIAELETARRTYDAVRTTEGDEGATLDALMEYRAAETALGMFDQELARYGIRFDGDGDHPPRVQPASARTAVIHKRNAPQPPRDPALLEPGFTVRIDTRAVLPNGNTIGGHARFSVPGSRTAQGGTYDGDPRYSLASSVTQIGNEVEVRPRLYLDGRLVGQGRVTLFSGGKAVVILDNGQEVTVAASLRRASAKAVPRPRSTT